MSTQIVIVINRRNSVFDVFKSNKREFNFFESRIQELHHAAYLLCLENVGNSDSPTNSRNAEVASLGEHDENKKLSYLTCLLTTTPQARLVILKTRPVLPWYTLCGIPLWMAPFTLTIRKNLYTHVQDVLKKPHSTIFLMDAFQDRCTRTRTNTCMYHFHMHVSYYPWQH